MVCKKSVMLIWRGRQMSMTLFYSSSLVFYSHSIVAGGLLEISYTTRLMPRT